jgi:hypothetical protein
VQLFAEHLNARTPAERRRAEDEARAVLAMAAGAAMFMTTVARDVDSQMLSARITELLTAAVHSRYQE